MIFLGKGCGGGGGEVFFLSFIVFFINICHTRMCEDTRVEGSRNVF